MDYDKLKQLLEDIYTLTWDYNCGDPKNADEMKAIVDTINSRIRNFFKRYRVRVVWCDDAETNLYMREDEYQIFREGKVK